MPFPIVDAGRGVMRQVLAERPEMMVVAFTFGPNGRGLRHNHRHVQSTFVQSGRFAFEVGETSFEVGPGDAFVIPSGVEHGCRALEPGVLIDTFTPRRDDFL